MGLLLCAAAVKAAEERAKAVATATEKLQQSEAAFELDRKKRVGATVPKDVAHRAALAARQAQEAALEAERELVQERHRRQDAEAAAQALRTATLRMRQDESRAAALAEEATSRLSSLEKQMLVTSAEDEKARNASMLRLVACAWRCGRVSTAKAVISISLGPVGGYVLRAQQARVSAKR